MYTEQGQSLTPPTHCELKNDAQSGARDPQLPFLLLLKRVTQPQEARSWQSALTGRTWYSDSEGSATFPYHWPYKAMEPLRLNIPQIQLPVTAWKEYISEYARYQERQLIYMTYVIPAVTPFSSLI